MTRPAKGTASAGLAFFKPCLAQAATEPPSGEDWVHEIKYDGYRIQAHLAASNVSLFTRNAFDWTNKLGDVAGELGKLGVKAAIIDGEAVVQNKSGVSNFHALQRELDKGPKARIALMAFDLLHLEGVDVRRQPLLERKAMLKDVLGTRPKSSLLQFGDHMRGDGKQVFASACKLGLEGIISKRVDRPYHSGRSTDWLKIKCALADAFVVIGYVRSKAASQAIGSLVLGYYDGRTLIYAGRVGTGFSASEAAAIWEALQTVRADDPPLSRRLTREQREGVVWVRPALVAQVEYRGWTPENHLWHSSFKAFRQDKWPSQIGRPASLVERAG